MAECPFYRKNGIGVIKAQRWVRFAVLQAPLSHFNPLDRQYFGKPPFLMAPTGEPGYSTS